MPSLGSPSTCVLAASTSRLTGHASVLQLVSVQVHAAPCGHSQGPVFLFQLTIICPDW